MYTPLLEDSLAEAPLSMCKGKEVNFSWVGLSVEVMPKSSCSKPSSVVKTKRLVKDSTGMVRSGQMMALMGASGAGKTSLLNALTGRNTDGLQITGRRIINDCIVSQEHLKAVSAYLQQEDLFIGTMTVREHLNFQALCRMDKRISSYEKMERVEQLLDKLGLKKSENTQIGIAGMAKGISGGEMKRLALASELLNNPSLLFCDEPTSGLDSYMAASVVEALSNLAKEGSTVILTIHQPSSQLFAMFDQLLLISEGRTAYQGNARDVSQFFASCGHPCPSEFNPADHFINVLSIPEENNYERRKAIDAICHQYEKMEKLEDLVISSEKMKKMEANWGSPYKASWCMQFKALMERSWLSVIRNPRMTQVKFLQTIIISLLLCAIYYGQDMNQAGIKNLQGVIFFLCLNQSMTTFNASVYVFVAELPIFLREHSNGVYRADVYFITKQLADIPLFIILSLIMTCLVYFTVGFNPDRHTFLMAVIITQLITHTALSFSYLISCATNSQAMATTVGSCILIALILMSGFFNQSGSLPVWLSWLNSFSWILFANQALNINQWANIQNITCEYNTEEATCIETGNEVLAGLGFDEDNFWINIGELFLLAVIYRVLAFLFLLYKTISKEKEQ